MIVNIALTISCVLVIALIILVIKQRKEIKEINNRTIKLKDDIESLGKDIKHHINEVIRIDAYLIGERKSFEKERYERQMSDVTFIESRKLIDEASGLRDD